MSIKIEKNPVWVKEPTKEDSLIRASLHIRNVQKGCAFFADKISEAGVNHDYTKISFADDLMDDWEKWFQMHVSTERHHLNDKCPDDVTLIDVLEKIIDVTMSAMAKKGYVSEDIISDEILQKAYKNTIEMLKREIVIEND